MLIFSIIMIALFFINMFLYNMLNGKPKTVKGNIFRIACYIAGGIPIFNIAVFVFHFAMLICNIEENDDPTKWYNKPL